MWRWRRGDGRREGEEGAGGGGDGGRGRGDGGSVMELRWRLGDGGSCGVGTSVDAGLRQLSVRADRGGVEPDVARVAAGTGSRVFFVEDRLVPVNATLALVARDGGWFEDLAEQGFRLHALELNVQSTPGVVRADVV